jgi:hypothetical protein
VLECRAQPIVFSSGKVGTSPKRIDLRVTFVDPEEDVLQVQNPKPQTLNPQPSIRHEILRRFVTFSRVMTGNLANQHRLW